MQGFKRRRVNIRYKGKPIEIQLSLIVWILFKNSIPPKHMFIDHRHLGSFDNIKDAAEIYQMEARKFHGKFYRETPAKLENFSTLD